MGFVKDETPWCGGRLSERVLCLRADNPSPMTYVGTNTYIVAEPGSDACAVIDPAPVGVQVQRVLDACKAEGLRIEAIIATHDHPDHIEGIPELAAATGAPVFAPRLSAIEEMLEKGTAEVPADCEEACAISPMPVHSIGDRPLLDNPGEWTSAEGSSHSKGACPQLNELPLGPFVPFEGAPQFEAIALPGHSEDSVGLLLPSEKALFTGDVLFRHGPTVVFHPDGVLGSYFETLNKLQHLAEEGKALRFYPGHGYPIEDPLPIIEATRAHREERLEQVEEALAQGVPANPDALFEAVYQGVDPALRAPSIRSIQAQLKHLGINVQ